MPGNDPQFPYMSYLLRVWRVEGQAPPKRRALLENTATGERVGFSSLAGRDGHSCVGCLG